MERKKIIWIVNEYNLPGVSRTRQTVLSQRLEEHGYKVFLICGSTVHKTGSNALTKNQKVKKVFDDGATYYLIRTSSYHRSYERVLVAVQFQYRIWRYRNLLPKPDVIVSDFAGLFGNVFLKWKKKYGTRIIFDVLDLWPEDFIHMGYLRKGSMVASFLYKMEHKSYKNADGLIFSFQGGRDYIIDKGWSKESGGDVDTSNIGYLNNGVDLEVINKQKHEFVLNDPDLDSSFFKAVYLGSISEYNGVDVIVETAKILQERNEDGIMILLYGYGNKEDEMKALAQKYNLRNIKFKGKLDKQYAMNVLSRGNLNLFTFKNLPSLKYGVSPNKLFMYFASGKPVLSMIKPAYDLVESNEAGLSVNNDPNAIADAIVMFSHMKKEEYRVYSENALQLASEYDYKELVNELIKQIEGKR